MCGTTPPLALGIRLATMARSMPIVEWLSRTPMARRPSDIDYSVPSGVQSVPEVLRLQGICLPIPGVVILSKSNESIYTSTSPTPDVIFSFTSSMGPSTSSLSFARSILYYVAMSSAIASMPSSRCGTLPVTMSVRRLQVEVFFNYRSYLSSPP